MPIVVYHLAGGLSNAREVLNRFFTLGLQVCLALRGLSIPLQYATIFAMKTIAFNYLSRERTKHIDMLEILEIPSSRVLFADESGVLIVHDGLYLLSCDAGRDEAFLPLLTKGLSKDTQRMIVLHGPALKETLIREYAFCSVMDCRHGVYQKREPVAFSLPSGAEIRRLNESHLDFVRAHYHMVDDASYLRERIKEGMFGAFVGGALAGFIGTHSERSIGLLEILPEYRRLGLAYALEANLINHLLTLGRTPFCQVSILNEASLALQRKLGLELSDAVLYWLVRGRVF